MRTLLSTVTLLLLVFVFGIVSGISAQVESTKNSLSRILNPDGSIGTNVAGNFDTSGYRLSYGPGGEPRLAPMSPGAIGGCAPDSWDTAFTTNGTDGEVNVIASDGAGNVYFGGSFTSVQGIPIRGIAKWNGVQWSSLGTGTGTVNAIAISGTDVYVGGNFAGAGGVPAKNVAKWNGSSWSALGAGLGGGTHVVEAIAVFGSDIYIGGNFNTADGSPANGLVRWDGSAYSAAGVSGQVYALAISGGDLYVGGFVSLISDPTSGGLLKWDGVSWSNLGLNAASTTVRSIGFNNTDIWVGGSIRPTGATSNVQVARWNGSSWTTFFFSNSPAARAFAFVGSTVYVAGSFQRSGGIGVGNGILKYDGTQWSAIGSGTELGDHTVNTIFVSGNTFYLGGDFQMAGGIAARNIATLTNGTAWGAAFPGTGVDSSVSAIAVSGSDVYVGGTFISAGNLTANRIAKWNSLTNTWSPLGGGIFGFGTDGSSISTIAVAGGKVYAGGTFSTIGGISAANIAVWNGSTWSALGSGTTGRVSAIVVHGDDLYVAGDFQNAGGIATNRIAKWDGTSWFGFNAAPIPNSVTGLAFIGDDMYVSSDTTTAETPNYLLKYDGSTWTGLATGMGGAGIRSIVAWGTNLYAAGGFSAVGGVPANRIAKWNGSSWSALGAGLPSDGTFGINQVFLGRSGTDLIASGNFTVASGAPGNRIARWNGSSWSPLGNGLAAAHASQIVAAGGDIFVGGGFITAGCNQSPNLARWRETLWTGSANTDWHNGSNWGSGTVPAPNTGVTISSSNGTISSADVTVSSLVVTGGRNLAIAGGRTLTVTGDLDIDNGAITGPGILIVNGNVRQNGDIFGVASLTINGSLALIGGRIDGGPVRLTSCNPGALAGGGSTAIIQSSLTRCVNATGTFVFPVGTGAPGSYGPLEVSGIIGNGDFTVQPGTGAYPGVVAGLPSNRLQRWWNTSATGVTQANLVFGYLDSDVIDVESRYRAYRIDAGAATQFPTSLNTVTNRATVTGVSSFSAWTLAEGIPAPAAMIGRVTGASGRGAAGVIVTLDDGQGNIHSAVTNPFGYYRFQNVLTFRLYTVTVRSKKYTFAAPQRTVEFDEFTTSVNFSSTDH